MSVLPPSGPLCTEEDLLVEAPEDLHDILPRNQDWARGTDGVIPSASPWTLTGASVGDFAARGVSGGDIIVLSGLPNTSVATALGAEYDALTLVVDSVSTTTITMRRAGMASGKGMPPNATGTDLTGVEFRIPYLDPQILSVSRLINEELNFDVSIDSTDSNVRKDLAIWGTLARLYEEEWRQTKDDIWQAKSKRYYGLFEGKASRFARRHRQVAGVTRQQVPCRPDRIPEARRRWPFGAWPWGANW